MKLTQKQRDKLWGETGPYSETRLTIETRILDDSVSRIFVVVEVSVNPLTYEIILKNLKEFINDSVMDRAQIALKYAEETLIKMHQYVIDLLDLKGQEGCIDF